MRKRILMGFIGLVVSSFLMVFDTPAATPAGKKEPIKVGMITNMSGPYSEVSKKALTIGLDEVNKAGGILGQTLQLVMEDSRGQMPAAVAAYKKLVVTDGVKIVVVNEGSDFNFACQEAGAALYPEYPHLLFNPFTRHDGLTDRVKTQYSKYKFFFRNLVKATENMKEFSDVPKLYKSFGYKKAAIVIEDSLWTEAYRKGIPGVVPSTKETFEQTGFQVVYYTENAVKETMFLPIFAKIAAAKPDVIFWTATYSDVVTMIKQWVVSDAKDMEFFQSSVFRALNPWERTGGACLGITSSMFQELVPATPKSKPLYQQFETGKVKAAWMVAGNYDTPFILKAAVEKVGGLDDMDAVIKAIEKNELIGASGTIKWTDDHNYVWGYPYFVDLACGQYQGSDDVVLVSPPEVAKITNPTRKYVPIKELRAKMGQK
jgi:ABC-type branched-subunit amino acid transport system substrate-binding protein